MADLSWLAWAPLLQAVKQELTSSHCRSMLAAQLGCMCVLSRAQAAEAGATQGELLSW